MTNISLNITFNIEDAGQRTKLNAVLDALGYADTKAASKQLSLDFNKGTEQKQQKNNIVKVSPNNERWAESRNKMMNIVLEVLRNSQSKGAFVYTDIYKNKDKLGFEGSDSRLYSLIDYMVDNKIISKHKLYNPNSGATNKLQDYIQLL